MEKAVPMMSSPTRTPAPTLIRVTYPPRYAGVIVCFDHLMELSDAELLQQGLRHDEILSEVVEFIGHRCLMCGVDPSPGRRCENESCRRALHPRWPAVYCCNECALEDV